MTEKNNSILSSEYLNFKNEITARIRSAQYEALKAVNEQKDSLNNKDKYYEDFTAGRMNSTLQVKNAVRW